MTTSQNLLYMQKEYISELYTITNPISLQNSKTGTQHGYILYKVAVSTLQTGYPYAQDLSRVPRRQ
jgi:hypothetical protein